MDRIILEKHCDVVLKEDEEVLFLAYLNSHFQTGLKNVIDRAILRHIELHEHPAFPEYAKVDEIPFDFSRRLMSVVVKTPDNVHRLICKGAPEQVYQRCNSFALDGQGNVLAQARRISEMIRCAKMSLALIVMPALTARETIWRTCMELPPRLKKSSSIPI